MIFDVLLIIFFVHTLVYLISQRKSPDFPPGPFGLPIVGHLLQLGKAPYIKLQNEWKDKYGPIVGIQFGSYRTVAISGYKYVKNALLEAALAGRPDMPAFQVRSRDVCARGILFTEGQQNTENRRMALRSLKEFGYGVKSFENLITSEVISFLDHLEKNANEGIDMKNLFHVPILNILWTIVAGKDCEDDRDTLNELFRETTKILEEKSGLNALFMFLPWTTKYFPRLSGFDSLNGELDSIWNFLGKHIEEHKIANLESPGIYHDYIGYFLNEMHKTSSPNSFLYKEAGERNLMTSLIDLFFAGTDTTANTLHWCCLLLVCNPQVQTKLHEEIDRIVGKSRLPESQDESNMPYTQAFIQEVLRFITITPFAVFHNALQDVNFNNYKIPKDTMILINLHGAHHDKEYWGDPDVLRPERFLAADGKSLIKHEAFFPFGLGKRLCLGEAIARNELFLFLTSLLQRFRVESIPGNPKPDLTPTVSLVLMPPKGSLVFKKRC